jgi:hypothetical protein
VALENSKTQLLPERLETKSPMGQDVELVLDKEYFSKKTNQQIYDWKWTQIVEKFADSQC